jgi:hypothetical protein
VNEDISSGFTDAQLEAIYKAFIGISHVEALRKIFEAGILEGISRVANATP